MRRGSICCTSSRISGTPIPGRLEETILTEVVANALDSGGRDDRARHRPGRRHADRRRRRPGHAAPRARPLPRHRRHDQDARPGHRLRRRRDQARPPGLGGGRDRDPPGRRSRRDALGARRRVTGPPGGGSRRPGSWPGRGTACGSASRTRCRRSSTRATSRRRSAALPAAPRSRVRRDPGRPLSARRGLRAERRADSARRPAGDGVGPIAVRLARKRKPSAAGYLVRDRAPLPEEQRGLAISTFGKVIKRGWDWLGLTPAAPDRIGGLIEVPALAECLTLNKADFIRVGARGAVYLAYRKAIQEAVTAQLARVGRPRGRGRQACAAASPGRWSGTWSRSSGSSPRTSPCSASLVERRAGGQRRLPMGRPGHELGGSDLLAPLDPMHGEAPLAEAGAARGSEGGPGSPAADQSAAGASTAGLDRRRRATAAGLQRGYFPARGPAGRAATGSTSSSPSVPTTRSLLG